MGWSVGFDRQWKRDIGYGVPAYCDYPGCGEEIDRGLSYVCGGEPHGGEFGCGLYFCEAHLSLAGPKRKDKPLCKRCLGNRWGPYKATPDHPDWINHKATDPSWARWRAENPGFAKTAYGLSPEALRSDKQEVS